MRRSKKRGAVGVLRRIFPEAPDFLSMLAEQCEVLVEAHAALVRKMSKEDAEHDIALIDAIRRGAETHRHTLDRLNRAFVTPIDREDISLASDRIAQVFEYIESTDREMELLDVPADAQIQRMVATLGDGIEALRKGFVSLGDQMLDAEAEASEAGASQADCFDAVVKILKRREVYRHLSNAADRVASAAETLHAIVVKWT